MIIKSVPGFCFVDPKNRDTAFLSALNIRLSSIRVTAEPRTIRMNWNPELAQDLNAFHVMDAEAELTALLAENIAQEIDRQILQELNPTQRHLQQWADLIRHQNNNPLIHHGHRAPQDNPPPDFGNIILPMVRRVAAQTMGLDLVPVQPLGAPQGLLHYIDYNIGIDPYDYTVLANEEGWFMKGVFESLFINMNMKPHEFIEKIRRTRRGRRGPQVNRRPNVRTIGNPPNYGIRDYRI